MTKPVLVIACGALARKSGPGNGLRLEPSAPQMPGSAAAHRPERIADQLRIAIERYRGSYDRIFIGYADCGTAGAIDKVIKDYYNIERLPGAHCYQFYAGAFRLEQLAGAEPGSFYLTDFLVRNFKQLVFEPLRLDEYPDHIGIYFANYSRVVYLSQNPNEELLIAARNAAAKLCLPFEHLHCGYGELQESLAWQQNRVNRWSRRSTFSGVIFLHRSSCNVGDNGPRGH